MRLFLQFIDIFHIWCFLHISIIPTFLKLYINKGVVLNACVLPVSSISPSFLKNLGSKVENKIVSKFDILSFVYFKGRNMAVSKITLFS